MLAAITRDVVQPRPPVRRRAAGDDGAVTVLTLADRDRWEGEHARGGLPGQSWHYAYALSASGLDPKLAVVRAGAARMLLAYSERSWGDDTDIATIYGLSGAQITPSHPAPLVAWHEHAAACGWVAGYIQLGMEVALGEPPPGSVLAAGNQVFLLDLQGRDVAAAASAIVRRKVRRALRRGWAVEDDREALVAAVRRLYPLTWGRTGGWSAHDFSSESLERWARDPDAVLVGARRGQGEVEAVSLFTVAGEQAEYHLNGSTEDGRELAALLIVGGAARLREQGVRTLNLGGGTRPGDGVFQFKQRFRGVLAPIRAVHQIYDRDRYAALCAAAGVDRSERWFPAYRAAKR